MLTYMNRLPTHMNRIYIISDTHFGHKTLYKKNYRPLGFEQTIMDNIKKLNLTKSDVLIHLGDVSIRDHLYYHVTLVEKSHTNLILVRGNHDNKSIFWYISNGWNFVTDKLYIKIKNKTIAFSHEPLIDNNSFDINIFGHIHNRDISTLDKHIQERLTNKHRLFILEHIYKPILLDQLLSTKYIPLVK